MDQGQRHRARRQFSAAAVLRRVVLLVCATVLAMLAAPPAQAVWNEDGPTGSAGDTTELVMTGFGSGQGVSGGIASSGSTFDPLDGYPDPADFRGPLPADFDFRAVDFAGTITASSSNGTRTAVLYCIDLLTTTSPGIGYRIGSWDQSTVPNVGYVARLLNGYYPAVPGAPSALGDDNERAASVQAAIWFFTDRFVLIRSDPRRRATSDIVAAVLAAGPLNPPPLPSLSLTPASVSASVGSAAGPFTVESQAGEAVTVRSSGASMFADPAGSAPIPQDGPVADGQQIWLRASAPGPATLRAAGTETVPTGSVYLYDGHTPDVATAQKLILAASTEVTVRAAASATFAPTGSVAVTTDITGPAAGTQGAATVTLACSGRPEVVIAIPAGATGQSVRTVDGIPAGTSCTVTEPNTGALPAVDVAVDISPGSVVIPPGGVAAVMVTNTVTVAQAPLVVDVAIAGPAAAQHGLIDLVVGCDGRAVREVPIAAGQTTVMPLIVTVPVGSACTVTEPADGGTPAVSVTVSIVPATVIVPPGTGAQIAVVNSYDAVPPTPTTTPTTTTTITPTTSTTSTTSTTPTTTSTTGSSGTTATSTAATTTALTTHPTTVPTVPTSSLDPTTGSSSSVLPSPPPTTATSSTSGPHVLPVTGMASTTVPMAAAAAIAVTLGVGFVVLGRRRGRSRHR